MKELSISTNCLAPLLKSWEFRPGSLIKELRLFELGSRAERRLPAGIIGRPASCFVFLSAFLSLLPAGHCQDSFDSTVSTGSAAQSESQSKSKPASEPAPKESEEKPKAAPDPVSIAEHVNRGNSLMRARHYQEAMAEYKAARAQDPKNPIVKRNIAECYNNMGVSLYRQRNFPNAIIQFEKCLQVFPAHGQARQNINLCRQMMDREGIPDSPSEDPYEDPEEKQKKAESESKKEADGPKVGASSSSSSVSVSSGGNKLYVSGSQIFPVYSEQASAVNERVLPTNPVLKPPPSNSAASTAGAAGTSTGLPAQVPNGIGTAAPNSWGTPVPALNQPLGGPAPGQAEPPPGAAASIPTPTQGAGTALSPTSASTVPVVPAPVASPGAEAATQGGTGAAQVASYGSGQQDGLSLEDKLSAIEMKLYGKKNGEMAIMKRLEQLEIENFGQVRQGTNFERVEYLRKAISNN